YELIKGFRFACRNKKEESYNRQQTDTLFKKRKMSALRFAESIMRLPSTKDLVYLTKVTKFYSYVGFKIDDSVNSDGKMIFLRIIVLK
ncbi:hypothetical protein, partial [Treponema sp.]|uniref:hypothetical protein n=1 Tax=Treponema sp. TaxID=166 RepID=UPI002A831AA3